jgi:hypothetical protein
MLINKLDHYDRIMSKKITYLVSIFFLSFLITFIYGNLNIFQNVASEDLNNRNLYKPDYQYKSGKELAMVYISSPNCGYCTSPNMPEYVEKSKLNAQKIAKENDANFSVIGVAIGWSVQEGLDHLENFGTFDEVMAGRNWFNIGARKYIYNEIPSGTKGSVPQIVLILRNASIESGTDKSIYKVTSQSEFARLQGRDEIKKFASGASISSIN